MAVSNSSLVVRETEKGATFEVWQGSGTMRLDWTRQGAMRIIVEGHGHAEYAPPVLRRFETILRTTPRITILADFWEMPGYDSGLRVELSAWGAKHRSSFDLHVISRSKLVTMGVAVASLAMGGISSHTQRSSFDAEAKRLGFVQSA